MTELQRLKREEVFDLAFEERNAWFDLVECNHKKLKRASQHLEDLIMRKSKSNVVGCVGMTGVGKTTVISQINDAECRARWFGSADISEKQVITVKAPSSGEVKFSWKTLWRRILEAANEPLIDHKKMSQVEDGFFKVLTQDGNNIDALRRSVEKMLIFRKVRLLIIDEGLHLLRFKNHDLVMDTLKSVSDLGMTKILLVGPFELAPVLASGSEVARRSNCVLFDRYHHNIAKEREEFERIIGVLLSEYPCKEVPDLLSANFCLTRYCAGSIGLIKEGIQHFASLQMRGRLKHTDLEKAWPLILRPDAYIRRIEAEATAGEALVKNLLYDEPRIFMPKAA